MSFKDQFLKAGLIDKKKAKKVEAETRRSDYDEKKGKKKSGLEPEKKTENQALKEQRQRVDALNEEINRQRALKEKQERLYQLIDGSKVAFRRGNISYFFLDREKRIQRLKVYSETVRDLAFGNLAICSLFDDGKFYLVSRKTAETILDFYPEKVITLHPRMHELPDDFYV